MSSLFNGSMGQSGVDTGDIPASLRFRGDSVNCNLTRTPTAGNLRKWTISGWVKRSALTANFPSLFSATLDASFNDSFYFDNTDALVWNYSNTGTALASSAKYRDPTAFLHVVAVWDTDNATASNRARIYVNGVELTSFTTDNRASIANRDSTWNRAVVNYVGGSSNSALAMRGYLSRICFVDGQALTPSSFGYLNTEINEWVSKSQSQVKAIVDAGGTNSFMLDFDDGTSLTTLGYDKSSKGNNWTLNNFSLTAGTSYDWMLDVPGNSFATLNPLFPTTNTISNGNLRGALAASVNAGYGIRSTIPMVSGKYEAEFVPAASADSWSYVGVCPASLGISDVSIVGSNAVLYRAGNGNKNVNGTATAYGASWTTEAIRVAVDMDARTVTFYKAGVSQGAISLPSSTENYIFVMANGNATTFTAEVNFGQQPITFDSGFGGICQRNMPDPAILNPEKHFDVVTRSGFGSSGGSVSSLQFQPDFLWEKPRNSASSHTLLNSVVGVSKYLNSNGTGAEVTDANYLTAFNSNGYSFGNNDYGTGMTLVDWLWKAGGAAVTNNAGSISSQVSANVDAGFSIVTYTGTGANATVGHGLSKAPKMVIVKQRSSGTTENWAVYNANLANTEYLLLNGTAAKATDTTYWNSATPSTTVFSVGSAADTNENTKDYVAYCFTDIEGYSKAFSYTGNGSTDGSVVNCGFKPKFVLLKNASAVGGWVIHDTVRQTYNFDQLELYPYLSNAEATGSGGIDVTSNGFKVRSTQTYDNGSGNTIIGIAFADVPAKYSLGR